jgi:hypothetical protein
MTNPYQYCAARWLRVPPVSLSIPHTQHPSQAHSVIFSTVDHTDPSRGVQLAMLTMSRRTIATYPITSTESGNLLTKSLYPVLREPQLILPGLLTLGRDSSVVQRWGTGWIIWGSSPGMGWGFFSLPPRPDRPWVPLSLLSNGYQGLFAGGKTAGCEAHHSSPSSAEIKKCVELYLHSPIRLSCRGSHLKHRDIFTFPSYLLTLQHRHWRHRPKGGRPRVKKLHDIAMNDTTTPQHDNIVTLLCNEQPRSLRRATHWFTRLNWLLLQLTIARSGAVKPKNTTATIISAPHVTYLILGIMCNSVHHIKSISEVNGMNISSQNMKLCQQASRKECMQCVKWTLSGHHIYVSALSTDLCGSRSNLLGNFHCTLSLISESCSSDRKGNEEEFLSSYTIIIVVVVVVIINLCLFPVNQESWVSTVNRLRAWPPEFDSCRGQGFIFSSPPHSDRLLGPPSLLSNR